MGKQKKLKLGIGDIFSIKLGNKEYAYGRALSKVSIGHCIEIFEYIGSSLDCYKKVDFDQRLMTPQIIDSHSIFWLRDEGEWELLVKGDESFRPSNIKSVRFSYGDKSNPVLVDVEGNRLEGNVEELKKYPPYSPKGDIQIRRIIQFWRDKKLKNQNR